mmetsp:Transcript_78987/g.164069  ORF Transcript_78987/g.164069 Transcript_78987/m.164069 type:complete len:179 (-) Transcript_78987:505-1041(-)|eukprot:CAMPEP_0194748036 /NCGR_PEP_ID=MMETSP0323_2-20130528/2246_1 /TAXON_ID=2866 ORGANISM="Crypthecodinium cohnii, Strain Seligo" /NCGR_SAMPLE_ID=MMETSP0323_2 /ASSEMBLY_ACC=CAM_ASM_000346 /LENGTH=178 /DNA_ID=CAMNT_0039662027 /DNA_START=59 /DNA_END=595 /DNA_ORIENTATION=+
MGCLSSKLADVGVPVAASQYRPQQPYAYQARPCQQGPYDQGCYPNQGYCPGGRYGAPSAAPYSYGGATSGYYGDYSANGGYGPQTGPYGQRPMYAQQPSAAGNGGEYGKMALAAAGGVAAGAGAVYMFDHAGDIADGFGDVAGFVGRGIEGAGDFAGDALEDVGDFMGGGFQDLGRLF